MKTSLEIVFAYHEATKHRFEGYARGPGRMDWATQPDPFRRYEGAKLIQLERDIIPIQLLLNGRLVKTVGFGDWRDVGDPVKSAAVYNSQQADELVFLNIDRDRSSI